MLEVAKSKALERGITTARQAGTENLYCLLSLLEYSQAQQAFEEMGSLIEMKKLPAGYAPGICLGYVKTVCLGLTSLATQQFFAYFATWHLSIVGI